MRRLKGRSGFGWAVFFCLWWKGVFAGVFWEKCVQDVVILWFGCGGLCGEDGLLDVGFWWVDFLQS